ARVAGGLADSYDREDVVLYIQSPFVRNSVFTLICTGMATLGVVGLNAWIETELKVHEGFRKEVIISVLVNFLTVEMPIVLQRISQDYHTVQRTIGYGRPDIWKAWLSRAFKRAYAMFFSFPLNHVWGREFHVPFFYRFVSVFQALLDMTTLY